MNMKLNADLAVLSACETANGRVSLGEGVMGTSWAFFIAGTRNVSESMESELDEYVTIDG